MTTKKNPGTRNSCLALLALAAASLFAGACDRAHLSSYYGTSYAAWFGIQQQVQGGGGAQSEPTRSALGSLDSQEAAAVSKNYRKNVGGEASQGQGQMVMIGQTHTGGGEGLMPAASVPGGQ